MPSTRSSAFRARISSGQLLRPDVAAGLVVKGLDADLGRVLALHAHVDGRRRVVADEDRREARLAVHGLDLAA